MTNIVFLKPRISEKSYALADKANTYVFDVASNANKHDIARSVAGQYEVTVIEVRVSAAAGKPKRTIRGRGRTVHKSHRSDIRKAYVTLKEGDKLPIFSAVEESNPPAKEAK
jgi:large subunit ribosomal protein L23